MGMFSFLNCKNTSKYRYMPDLNGQIIIIFFLFTTFSWWDTAGNSEQDSTILPTQMAQSLSRIQLSFPLTELAI